MGCDLGFDNRHEDERTLPSWNPLEEQPFPQNHLYDSILKLRERLKKDAGTETGHFDGVDIVINIPLDQPLVIKSVECKGWYHGEGSGSVLRRACSDCKYHTFAGRGGG